MSKGSSGGSSPIIIDDDFTVDVQEADFPSSDEEDFCIENEPHWNVKDDTDFRFSKLIANQNRFNNSNDRFYNSTDFKENSDGTFNTGGITIKEELDFEDNYLHSDQYVDLSRIKTEFEEEEQIEENEISPQEEIQQMYDDPDIPNIPTEPEQSDKVPENPPNQPVEENTSSEEILKETIKDVEKTQNEEASNENISTSETENCNDPVQNTPDCANEPDKENENNQEDVATSSSRKTSLSEEPLDRRKLKNNYRYHNHQPQDNKSLVLPDYHNRRNTNGRKRGKRNKRYNNNNNNLVSKWKSPEKFHRKKKSWRNNRDFRRNRRWNNEFQNRRVYAPAQDSSTFQQTYSTILGVLNGIFGQQMPPQNVNTFQNRQLEWNNQAMKRPQVWASDFQNNRLPMQLQTYTTILQAVTQLNNGVVGQNSQNSITCMNDVKFQMSFSNVF